MKYAEYIPDQQLRPYIDAYWTLETGPLFKPFERRIFADGCTEVFINIGGSIPVVNSITQLKPGNIYLGGTMTCANVVTSVPDSRFVGIRFKPAGLAAFYRLPLYELVDKVVEFPDNNLMGMIEIDEGLSTRLDHFFIRKLSPAPLHMTAIINHIGDYNGRITVDRVAKEHNLTTRTLERIFMREVGISPKSFINIVKFIHACKRIQMNDQRDSLLHIAYELGYYDHSHLTREFKKFSGLNPSEIR